MISRIILSSMFSSLCFDECLKGAMSCLLVKCNDCCYRLKPYNFIQESISCTDVLSKWLCPSTKNVEMASIDDIVWGKEKRATQDDILTVDLSLNANSILSDSLLEDEEHSADAMDGQVEIDEEIDNFLTRLRDNGLFCPIMAIREPFSKYFVEKASDKTLNETSEGQDGTDINHMLLSSVYDESYSDRRLTGNCK